MNLATGSRDIHSPANVDPSAYSYFGCWEPPEPVSHDTAMMLAIMGPEACARFLEQRRLAVERWIAFRKEIHDAGYRGNFASKGSCDHCGAHFLYGSVFKHEATGHLIVVGWICAEETFDCPTRAALDQKRARERVAGGREALRMAVAVLAWLEDDTTRVGVIGWLTDHSAESDFCSDLLLKMRRYGPLSPNQEAAVRKGPAMAAQRAERALVDSQAGPCPEGRMELVGTVVSTKWQESDYGETLKMLVRLENGSKVWGSVPRALLAPDNKLERDTMVTFTATVEVSAKDKSFGFFKRPSKASKEAG